MSGHAERCARKTCEHDKATHFEERKVVVVQEPAVGVKTGHPYRELSEVRTVYGKCSAAWCECNEYVVTPR